MTGRTFPDVDVLLSTGPGDAPAGSRLRHSPDEPELCSLYAHPPAPDGRSALVRASMISTIDGAAWGDDGRSGSINGQADYRAFRVMRALADIVLVGAGTARTEQYAPLRVPRGLAAAREAAGRPEHLHTAVVTRSGLLPDAMARAVDDDAAVQPFVVTSEAGRRNLPASVPAERVVVCGDEQVDLAVALDALAARGFTRVLCEGGPALLGSMLDADLVDEMCLTTSPQVLGGGATRPVVTSHVITDRPAARLAHLLHADGVLLARWTIRQTRPAPVV